MSIYSDTVQQQTDQLVADVTNLNTVVNSSPMDPPAVSTALDPVETDATNLNQTIKSADVPPDNTMILDLTNSILVHISALHAVLASSPIDDAGIHEHNTDIVEYTMNINRCVKAMEQYVVDPLPILQPPLPPWFQIPTQPQGSPP